MRDMLDEVRFAARALGRARGFSLSVVLILGLAVGANVLVWGVVRAVLERPMPFRDPDGVVSVWLRTRDSDRYPLSISELLRFRKDSTTLLDLAGIAGMSVNLTGEGDAERVSGVRASGNLFSLLGVEAEIGRTLLGADDAAGARVAVITDGLWRRRYGADRAVLGRTLTINGESYELVGVLPPAFRFPSQLAELAVPLATERDPMRQDLRAEGTLRGVGRLRPGIGLAQSEAELSALTLRLGQESGDPTGSKQGMRVVPYLDEVVGGVRRWLWTLGAAVACVLLAACANLAGLAWLRAAGRSRELAVRQALGATRPRLARAFLLESLLLGAAAAVVGGMLAWWGLSGLSHLEPGTLPRAHEIAFDTPLTLFAVLLALAGGLLSGGWPALLASRARLVPALKQDGGAVNAGRPGGGRARLRRTLVAAEVGLAMLLLAGAGLFLRSFVRLVGVDPGFDARGVLIARLALPRGRYGEPAAMVRFHDRLHDALRALPGVESAALISIAPMSGPLGSADVWRADRSPAESGAVEAAHYRVVSPDYLATVRTPLLRGRPFGEEDRTGTPPVAIVSRRLADDAFGSEDPIGRVLMVDDRPAGARRVTIVGVAADVRHEALDAPPVPDLYVPIAQLIPEGTKWLANNQFWAVRAARGSPEELTRAVSASVRGIDPEVAASHIRSLESYLDSSVSLTRLILRLVSLFALAALVLCTLGLYGLVAFSVAQRTREIGVRMALGAHRRDVLRLVLGEAAGLAFLGVASGALLGLLLTRLLAGLLFGIQPYDPLAYALAAAALGAAALTAAWVPARAAARVSPLAALRTD
jgi:predicted permease